MERLIVARKCWLDATEIDKIDAMSAPSAPMIERQHISQTPGVCGGKPCIAGTRIRVWDVAELTLLGMSPDEIVVQFPTINLSDVHAALAFYWDNKAAIDQQVEEGIRFAEEYRRKLGPGTLDRWREEGGEDRASVST